MNWLLQKEPCRIATPCNGRDEWGRTPFLLLHALPKITDPWRLRASRLYHTGNPCWVPTDDEVDDRWEPCGLLPVDWGKALKDQEQPLVEAAKMLVGKGADPMAVEGRGGSALCHAASNSWFPSVVWLMEMGLDPGLRARDGISCFEA